MASRGPSSRSAYVLMKDVQAVKQSSGFKKMIGLREFSVVNVHRGELLIQIPENERQQCGDGPLLNYRLFKDPNILLYSGEENVSPLGEHDFQLLEAIASTNDRFTVFSHPDKLDWGASLRKGSRVFVKIPNTQIVASAVIRCKGPVEGLPGISFGVEITDPHCRGQGSTHGVFRSIEYFQCDPNCGLFVSLEKLSAEPFVKSSSEQSYAGAVAGQKAKTDPHPMETRQKANEQRKIEVPFEKCNFRIGDRVMVHDKQGKAVHGKVVWAGKNPGARELECMYVGIETATQVRYTEVIGANPGLTHVASTPKGHFLALPQLLVEKYAEPTKLPPPQAKTFEANQDSIDTQSTKAIAARLGESYTQLMAAQIEFDENKKALDDERIKKFKGNSANPGGRGKPPPHTEGPSHNSFPEKNPYSSSTLPRSSSTLPRSASPPSLAKQSSLQDRRPSAPHEYEQVSPLLHHQKMNVKAATFDTAADRLPEHQQGEHEAPPLPPHVDSNQPRPAQESNGANLQPDAVLPSPSPILQHSLSVGSLIQLPSQNPQDEPRSGTIRWIGELTAIQGSLAGIELDDTMAGCTDGTFQETGHKFFDCPPGRGLYYPLHSLQPDSRFLPPPSAADHRFGGSDNPIDVAYEEKDDQLIQPDQIQRYLGEGHGIQGHQNSCYLDATVFGLFALNETFDKMFLGEAGGQTRQEISYILWKGIVNTLRKNGIVRFESVMRLREKLEELGKMKGIAQDEKDPEEFLNMLFKHTLEVDPFISIKRPSGVEQEFFVQLFLEFDKSLKLPTVGGLLKRMFLDEKISFTEVPSQLLIQVPRFGKKFKTYEKVIPELVINVGEITVPIDNYDYKCQICEKTANKFCNECASDFPVRTEDAPYFCDGCWGLVHSHSRRRGHPIIWCREVAAMRALGELELLSVICIETSHYVCFTRCEDRWVFFDSMANRVRDTYNIPKVVECTRELNEWVYPAGGNRQRLLDTPQRELPEFVRRFTQDLYLCIYLQPDASMY